MSAGKAIRYCMMQLEQAGLVGKLQFENEDGSQSVNGKTLTKKGTTDMDRIASQISKELKKRQ